MLEPGGEADLALEPLEAEPRGEAGVEDLEGHRAVVLEVAGQVDRGHAAASELALEAVIVDYGPLEPVSDVVGHGRELYY